MSRSLPIDFESFFPFPRNDTQASVSNILAECEFPMLIILESPMGCGKTEAALEVYLTARENGNRGFYYALPTLATGNQMFGRLLEFLRKPGVVHRSELHLLHGFAFLHPEYRELKPNAHRKGNDDAVVASEWFTSRKRGLIAEHGVGTLDQALLAALQVRHCFVRLFGLAGKVVIIDEVHAYDAYMSTVLKILIVWLRRLGSTVVLLSATLPSNKKRELLEAYGYTGSEKLAPYPSVTAADSSGRMITEEIKGFKDEPISVRLIRHSGKDKLRLIAETAMEAVRAGGCLACIMNTVGEAQELYESLRQMVQEGTELILFHSRFMQRRRAEIEERITRLFGKPNEKDGTDENVRTRDRPLRAIVVSTQVIEQSLDVDFDVMITDLAPIDLILQRSGRMHRHKRSDRAAGHSSPVLYVVVPERGDKLPEFGPSAKVYYPYILDRSLSALETCNGTIKIPSDMSRLVEYVYVDDDTEETGESGVSREKWIEEYYGKIESFTFEGRAAALPDLRYEDDVELLRSLSALDDPGFFVRTRLAEDSIMLVLSEDPEELNTELDHSVVKRFIQRSVTVSHRSVVKHFKYKEPPKKWSDHAVLRRFRPLVLQNGVYEEGKVRLWYDDLTGLHIPTAACEEGVM